MILQLHVFSTLALVGLIWVIQLVQYPQFSGIGREAFVGYHAQYTQRILWVVGPLMLAEILTLGWLLAFRPPGIPEWEFWVAAALVLVLWISTAFVQVPFHNRLSSGFEPAAHGGLVATNWIRTVAWTARGLIVIRWLGA